MCRRSRMCSRVRHCTNLQLTLTLIAVGLRNAAYNSGLKHCAAVSWTSTSCQHEDRMPALHLARGMMR